MFRNRAAAVALLLLVVFSLSPSASLAQRDAEVASPSSSAPALGDRLVGAALEWGQAALAWLQSLIDEEHGTIVPKP